MMELKRIDVADIRPNDKNPRSDFGDLDALWESFALNAANPGEPVNPIVVVADGPVYRIVDGERRYRAMSGHGQESCMAVVCEGYDDVESAVAMLATDDKLSLTAAESCQGIQQMLLLGVDVERVAAASKAPVESVRAVREVLRCRKGEGVFQATLDQMLAVADVDENGDGDMADGMLTDRNWQATYERFKRDRARKEQIRDLRRAAASAGFELLDGDFDQADYGPSKAVWSDADFQEAWEKGYRFAHVWVSDWGVQARAYLPKDCEPGKSEAELEAERKRAEDDAKSDEAQAALDALRAEAARWFSQCIEPGGAHPPAAFDVAVARALFDQDGGALSGAVAEFEELAGTGRRSPARPSLTYELMAYAFHLLYPEDVVGYSLARAMGLGIDALGEWPARHAAKSALDLCAVANRLIAAGWVLSRESEKLMREVERIAAWKPEGEDDGEDG